MVVIALSNCPASLRGDITLWLMELTTNVYVGNVSARVRDNLWERVCVNVKNGTAILAYSTNNEQGFDYRLCNSTKQIKDFDGLKLMFSPITATNSTYDKDGNVIVKESDLKPGYSKASQINRARYAKKRGRITLPEDFVILDLETTGLDSSTDRIIEIAAIKYNKYEPVEEFDQYVHCDKKLPQTIVKLTGITDDMLSENGVDEAEAVKKVLDFIDILPIIAHNAPFDLGFLAEAMTRNSNERTIPPYHDTVKWAKQLERGLADYRLDTLLKFYNISNENRHNAINDCRLLYKVIERMFSVNE
jgi:CRISPR-associated protein Cas2